MRRDVGVDGDAQRLGQLVWMAFLKVLDDKEAEWELLRDTYVSPLPQDLRWRSWAANDEGLTGDELLAFVNDKLFPGLKELEAVRHSDQQLASVVRGVFGDAYNYMKSGTLLRQVANILSRDLNYNDSTDRHEFGDAYEHLLRGLQSAGDAGEFYTPRPATQFMVDMISPRLNETVLDPACGTGGFLVCALDFLRENHVSSVEDDKAAQSAIRGIEKKPLPHLLCVTNLLLHGIEVPTGIQRANTLARPLNDYGASDRVDVVVTNPPFMGMEEEGIEHNFPSSIRTRETADLFLALTLHVLKANGRAAIVLPDSSLFGEDVKQVLRQKLLTEANLHTIVRLPHGVFSPYTDIRTNILFFEKGKPTKEVWFYEVQPPSGEKFTKTKPITHADLAPVRNWWNARTQSDRAWCVPVHEITAPLFDLNVENPHRPDLAAALTATRSQRMEAEEDLGRFRDELDRSLKALPGTVSSQVENLMSDLTSLGAQVALSTGVVEELRTKFTTLALQGAMSEPLTADEDIATTLARVSPSTRKRHPNRLSPPFAVPEHWKWVELADLAEFEIGRTPSTQDPRYWCPPDLPGIPFISISDMPRRGLVDATGRHVTPAALEESFGGKTVPAGTLLMAFKLSVGKTSIAGLEGVHNEAIASLKVNDPVIKSFLLWALPALAQHAAKNPAVRGSTLNAKSIAGLWVPVPPIQEQERIITNLRAVVELVEELSEVTTTVRQASEAELKVIRAFRAEDLN